MKLTRKNSITLSLVAILMLLILSSCGKNEESQTLNYEIKTISGVKTFVNDNKPSIDKIDMDIVEKYVINGDTEDSLTSFQIQQPIIDMDINGNIYITDMKSASIKKFDSSGKFLAQLGKKGTGPGEFFMPSSTISLNDTVYGFDATLKINKYDSSGKFTSAKNVSQAEGLPTMLKRAGNNFIGFRVSPEQKDNKIFLNFDLVLMDNKFKNILKVAKNRFELDMTKPMNPMDFITFFTVGNNEIFVAEKSTDHFKIKVYDFSGKSLYNITKKYRQTKYSQRELDKINKILADAVKNAPMMQPEMKLDNKFKDAITGMWFDKNGRLWVGTAKEDDGK